MAQPEELLRGALDWAKENGYTIERRSAYAKHCTATYALLQHSKQEGAIEVTKILTVSPEWVRAFEYGFSGSAPRLKGGDGMILEQPAEAYQLGLKLGLEFCGPVPWKY